MTLTITHWCLVGAVSPMFLPSFLLLCRRRSLHPLMSGFLPLAAKAIRDSTVYEVPELAARASGLFA